jgi:hypothetical protein
MLRGKNGDPYPDCLLRGTHNRFESLSGLPATVEGCAGGRPFEEGLG